MSTITTVWLDKLCALTSLEEQTTQVREAGLLDAAGLSALLDETEHLIRLDPGQADQLASLCEALGGVVNAPAIVPRAIYLRARVHAIHGEFVQARNLIASAHDAYEQLGLTLAALRTTVGQIDILAELGHVQDALALGDGVLAQLNASNIEWREEEHADRTLLMALIYNQQGRNLCDIGQYEQALDAFAEAETRFESLQLTQQRASTLNNRGVTLRYLGRIHEALETYAAAATTQLDHGYLRAVTLSNMGEAQFLLGNYTECLQTFEEARLELATLGAVIDQQSCTLHMAHAYLTLNLYPEALAAYQEAEQVLRETEATYQYGLALWGIGATAMAQGNLAQTETYLAQALAIFHALNNVPLQTAILLEQSALQVNQGNQATAFAIAQQALDLVTTSTDSQTAWPMQAVYAHIRMADLLLPDIDVVEAHLVSAEQLLQPLGLPHLRYRLNQRLGHLRLQQGQGAEAQELLEAAIGEIERLRNTLPHETMRTSFLHDKMAAYVDLLHLHLDHETTEQDEQDRLQQIFSVIERAKSRALIELMTGTIDARLDVTTDADMVAQLRTLQTELNAIYDELLRNSEGDPEQANDPGNTARRVPTLQKRTLALEQTLNRLRQQQTQRAIPPKRTTPFEHPITLREIQSQMPSKLMLVTYHILAEEIMAFVITADGSTLLRHVSTVSTIQPLLQQLRDQAKPFRGGSTFIERHLPILERMAMQLLAQLYDALFRPILQQVTGMSEGFGAIVGELAIVPHGLLHQVPFHALYDGERYLLEQFAISYAPSATVFALTQQRHSTVDGKALFMGVADPGIPAVEAELLAIAQELSAVTVLLNEEATHNALVALATDTQILHFACHGLFRLDNPMYSALRLHDTWLTGIEIAQLELTGALVVLSACESGRGQLLGGDEMIGLVRACLGAGAATLIVSQWLIQDDTTAILMAEFYAQVARGVAPAHALRAAQLTLKSSHPHPYYWAPFVLIGSRAAFTKKHATEERS